MRVRGEIAGHFARRVSHEAGVGGVGARILAALREVPAQAGLEVVHSVRHVTIQVKMVLLVVRHVKLPKQDQKTKEASKEAHRQSKRSFLIWKLPHSWKLPHTVINTTTSHWGARHARHVGRHACRFTHNSSLLARCCDWSAASRLLFCAPPLTPVHRKMCPGSALASLSTPEARRRATTDRW